MNSSGVHADPVCQIETVLVASLPVLKRCILYCPDLSTCAFALEKRACLKCSPPLSRVVSRPAEGFFFYFFYLECPGVEFCSRSVKL